MKYIIFGVSFLLITSKIFGFIRDITLSYYFGTSHITDVFLMSIAIPTIIFNFIGLGLSSAFIPIYDEIKEKLGTSKSNEFSSNIISMMIIVSTIFYLIILIFTKNILQIFAPGFNGEIMKNAVYSTRITGIILYFLSLINILTGILQVNKKFYFVAFCSIPFNIIYIIGIYFAYRFNNKYLIFTVVIAAAVQFLVLVIPIIKMKYSYQLILNFRDKYIKKLIMLAIPITLSSGIEQVNYIIGNSIASNVLKDGGITILSYANRLNLAIIGIAITPIVTVIFPKIVSFVNKKNIYMLWFHIKQTLEVIILFAVPITVGLIFYSNEIVQLIFRRGNFTMQDAKITSTCLRLYSISFFAVAIRELVLKIFYALKDTKTTLYISSWGMVLNITLNFILSKYIGLAGIALATSVSWIFATILLSLRLNKNPFFDIFKMSKILIKATLSALIMLGALYILKNTIVINSLIIKLILGGICGAIVYGIVLLFMRIELVDNLRKKILKF